MIDTDYIGLMARYASWRNRAQFAATETLSEDERRRDRSAFFRSIHGTLNHLLWGDRMWMSRFDGLEAPVLPMAESPSLHCAWPALCADRSALDAAIERWSYRLTPELLAGDLSWMSAAVGRQVTRPFQELSMHFFNHQTHHRGQAHAMPTAAGARPGDTDLFLMPAELKPG